MFQDRLSGGIHHQQAVNETIVIQQGFGVGVGDPRHVATRPLALNGRQQAGGPQDGPQSLKAHDCNSFGDRLVVRTAVAGPLPSTWFVAGKVFTIETIRHCDTDSIRQGL